MHKLPTCLRGWIFLNYLDYGDYIKAKDIFGSSVMADSKMFEKITSADKAEFAVLKQRYSDDEAGTRLLKHDDQEFEKFHKNHRIGAIGPISSSAYLPADGDFTPIVFHYKKYAIDNKYVYLFIGTKKELALPVNYQKYNPPLLEKIIHEDSCKLYKSVYGDYETPDFSSLVEANAVNLFNNYFHKMLLTKVNIALLICMGKIIKSELEYCEDTIKWFVKIADYKRIEKILHVPNVIDYLYEFRDIDVILKIKHKIDVEKLFNVAVRNDYHIIVKRLLPGGPYKLTELCISARMHKILEENGYEQNTEELLDNAFMNKHMEFYKYLCNF